MRLAVRIAVPAVAGYLLGSVPTAALVSREVDLRVVGDRNPGWWNARATLGPRAARPVLAGDIAKGTAGAAIGRLLARPGEWWMPLVGGGAAMVGHAWPLFARFRGGRSVATFGGAATVISPVTTAAAMAAGALAARASGSAERGIQAGFVAYPVVQLAVDGPRRTAATGLLMSFIGLRFWMARTRPTPLLNRFSVPGMAPNLPKKSGGARSPPTVRASAPAVGAGEEAAGDGGRRGDVGGR